MSGSVVKEFGNLTFYARHVGSLAACCTLVYDKETDSLAIFDPAGHANTMLRVIANLREEKTGPLAHSMIILTHPRLSLFDPAFIISSPHSFVCIMTRF